MGGWGAVSPAGWSGADLASALARHAADPAAPGLPVHRGSRQPGAPETATRDVPPPPDPAARPRHPRLRRTSPVARHAMAAALQAVGSRRAEAIRHGDINLGVVACVMNGCVQFSGRFYAEVLDNPATASPLLFPETVFNSPSSHISAALQAAGLNTTLIGDAAGFFSGLDLAAEWLEQGLADAVLVVAAEELDWLSAEAVHLFDRDGVAAGGAGALLLEPCATGHPDANPQPLLQTLAAPRVYGRRCPRNQAAAAVATDLRAALADGRDLPPATATGAPPETPQSTLLIDSRCGHSGMDRPESAAWADWNGPVWSPRRCLGEGFAAHGAWQCVAACEAIASHDFVRAAVSAIGGTMQAAGALFTRGG